MRWSPNTKSSISHGDGCYSFVRRRLSPEKELLLADMAKKLIRIQVFKDIKPSGDCGLTDAEILDLFNKFRADNPQLDAYEFGYQCALHMTKLKASLNSEVEKA